MHGFPKSGKANITQDEKKALQFAGKVFLELFALHLHTSASTVRKWERGETHPTGPALKLLNIIADKGLQTII